MSIWRPHTTAILVGGILLIIIAVAVAFMVSNFKPTTDVKVRSGVFSVRLATDSVSRQLGLSNVENLKPNEGLLMIFPKADIWGIWMKDMKVSIDILWLDKDKSVVYIVKNASHELSTNKIFSSTSPALYVLELPAGAVQQYGIKVGDKVEFDVDEGAAT